MKKEGEGAVAGEDDEEEDGPAPVVPDIDV